MQNERLDRKGNAEDAVAHGRSDGSGWDSCYYVGSEVGPAYVMSHTWWTSHQSPMVRRAAGKELPAARDYWSDEDIVFGESFGAFESFIEFLHFLLWNDDSDRVITVELHDHGMMSLPCHAKGAGFHDVPACQQHTVPFLLQR